ncbi:MAG: isoprenylcysteine carboxylmethyltransferase family protein [Candidatus Nanoarchaeia archaeon]|nr:isoprenylcysteine carboxylmethyltransferase family protein [Candidatus Nanoarchaeia archaeon]MDD5054076.1 isoprenylcysteine carboxylmethyltransferase family protein [Candidatus Nanoarchaeia archaeon]
MKKFLLSGHLAIALVFINLAVFLAFFDFKNFFGLSIALAGLIIYFYNLRIMGKSWSIGIKAGKLVTEGFFKYIRHPLYLGCIIACIGLVVMTYNFRLLGLLLFADLPFIWFKSKKEEEFLIKNMKGYADYMKKTFMFIPKIL